MKFLIYLTVICVIATAKRKPEKTFRLEQDAILQEEFTAF